MQFRLDQLGKNLLRDVFILVGSAETEVEVPPGDAQRIDLWHVPDPEMLRAHPEIEPGLLRSMAEEAGAVEVFSDAPGERAFHAVLRKRYAWHHTLELREKAALPLPAVWLICAGRPDTVLEAYAFQPSGAVAPGVYATRPSAWRIWVVVIGELPQVRSTLLLRLLGSTPVRRSAQRELAALPKDTWERQVAVPWLIRLCFDVPAEGLVAEERECIMETREWFEEWHRKNVDEPRQQAEKEAMERGMERGMESGLERGQLQMTAQVFALRLGRALSDAELTTLAARLRVLGQQRVGEVVLGFSADAAAAWLADPHAV